MKSSRLNIIILYLFPIISWLGFRYYAFNASLLKGVLFATIPLMFLYVGNTIFHNSSSKIFRLMKWFLGIMLFSMVMAYVVWDQSFSLTYRAMISFWPFLFYFFLVKANFSPRTIETFVWVNVALYIALYFYALSMAPMPIFGINDEEMDLSRGVFRIGIANRGCIALAMFFSITRWVNQKKKVYLLLAALCFVFIVLQVTRQNIIISLVILVWYILKNKKHVWVYVISLFLALQFVNIKFSDDSVIGALMNLSEQQIEDNNSGDTNIRIIEYEYFFTEYTSNPLAALFGNGVSHSESAFGKYDIRLQESKHLFQSDVGYASFYCRFGIIGLIVFFMLVKAVFKVRDNNNDSIISYKLFIAYLVLYHIASYAIVSDAIFFCIAVYMIDELTQVHTSDSKIMA